MITVCGTHVSRDDLRSIPLVRPENAGRRWRGVPHHDLVETLVDGLRRREIQIDQEAWSVDQNGASLVGGVTVHFPAYLGMPHLQGMGYALGLLHSNDQKHAITFAVGARVFICSNGLVTGRFVLRRKHTSGIDLAGEVNDGIDRFVNEARALHAEVERLQGRKLTERQSDHLLMEAGRQDLLPWSRIGQVQQEYAAPRHEAFRDRTSWSLYNALSEVAKKSSPARQLTALDRFRQILLSN